MQLYLLSKENTYVAFVLTYRIFSNLSTTVKGRSVFSRQELMDVWDEQRKKLGGHRVRFLPVVPLTSLCVLFAINVVNPMNNQFLVLFSSSLCSWKTYGTSSSTVKSTWQQQAARACRVMQAWGPRNGFD